MSGEKMKKAHHDDDDDDYLYLEPYLRPRMPGAVVVAVGPLHQARGMLPAVPALEPRHQTHGYCVVGHDVKPTELEQWLVDGLKAQYGRCAWTSICGGPTEVVPGIFISNEQYVRSCPAKRVVHIAKSCCCSELSCPWEKEMRVAIDDNGSLDIMSSLLEVSSFLRKAEAARVPVVVHCEAGFSRSPTFVIAHLMLTRNYDFTTAYNLVRLSRPQISPNFGFLATLHELGRRLGKD